MPLDLLAQRVIPDLLAQQDLLVQLDLQELLAQQVQRALLATLVLLDPREQLGFKAM